MRDFMNTETQSRLIKQSDVRHMIGDVSDTTIWRWLNEEGYESLGFPKPIKIKTRNYWNVNSVQKWIAGQTA